MPGINLHRLSYEALHTLRQWLIWLCRRAISEYERQPNTDTWREFERMRYYKERTEHEIEQREAAMLEMLDIRTVLALFQIPFNRRKGVTYI